MAPRPVARPRSPCRGGRTTTRRRTRPKATAPAMSRPRVRSVPYGGRPPSADQQQGHDERQRSVEQMPTWDQPVGEVGHRDGDHGHGEEHTERGHDAPGPEPKWSAAAPKSTAVTKAASRLPYDPVPGLDGRRFLSVRSSGDGSSAPSDSAATMADLRRRGLRNLVERSRRCLRFPGRRAPSGWSSAAWSTAACRSARRRSSSIRLRSASRWPTGSRSPADHQTGHRRCR